MSAGRKGLEEPANAPVPDATPAVARPAVLRGLRVLDLSDVAGALATRLLGGLGADVVRVEPPGGSRLRRIGTLLEGRDEIGRAHV